MDSSAQDASNGEITVDSRKERSSDQCSSSAAGYRLFGRQRSMHQIIGGGKGNFIAQILQNKFVVMFFGSF